MVEALTAGHSAFDQDRHPWVAATSGLPVCRRVDGLRVLSLRHAAGSAALAVALQAQGLAVPAATGDVTAAPGGLHAVRRQPEETIVVGADAQGADALLAALAPAPGRDAQALDLSHGLAVIALEGPRIDEWLSHLVDALAIPYERARATRTRLGDVAVLLLRLESDCCWLVADRSLMPYLANWLGFAHEGAFAPAAS